MRRHFRRVFRGSFRPEVVSDVISRMADQDVGMDACANFGDVISGVFVDPTGVKVPGKFVNSRLNRSREIRLPHFVTNDNDDDDDDNDANRRTL